ncbi:carbohydrate ABC transporter permease [Pseudonocardia humida]|uniref:Carbohydrate ABC transporter permease n=1 Tax=Pseudonocardia humida TaxID=2800819 RepID=A0ABT1AAQ3_9PSEU|nr:carbohydrate ABC transporter permease [Pseudonocardia humida]MCO1660083.1 carbohydrate ABC transporter permease [Pseudonocardia humida]
MTQETLVEPTGSSTAPAPRRWNRDLVETRVLGVLRWVVIVVLVLATVFPFYYMVVLSLRSLDEVLQRPGLLWPAELDFTTYVEVLASAASGGQGFLVFLRNSAVIALLTVAVTLVVAIPGSYAISRLHFRGRRQVSALFLAVYLFPAILLAVPLFVFFSAIGLRGSIVGLLVVYVAQTVPISIYMLRNYFETVPVSLEEAAAMDGATRRQIILKVSLPLAMPAVVSNALYVFMIAWNEFLFALLFLAEDRERWTVSLGLSQLAGSIEIPTTVLMAGSVLLTIPIVIIFFFTERLLVEGLTAGAEKG